MWMIFCSYLQSTVKFHMGYVASFEYQVIRINTWSHIKQNILAMMLALIIWYCILIILCWINVITEKKTYFSFMYRTKFSFLSRDCVYVLFIVLHASSLRSTRLPRQHWKMVQLWHLQIPGLLNWSKNVISVSQVSW